MHYMIASTLSHAIATAEIDWGWRRTRQRGLVYLNAHGEQVRLLGSDMHCLNGLRDDTKVYGGYRWYEVPGIGEWLRYWTSRGNKLIEDGAN